VCKEHVKYLNRGMTYEPLEQFEPSEEHKCEICEVIEKFVNKHQRLTGF